MQLAVSSVILALRPARDGVGDTLWVPLVRRIREPYLGDWALPGGPLEASQDLEEAARHTLVTTTGLDPRYLEQLYAFGGLDRGVDPAVGAVTPLPVQVERVVSIVYWALVRPEEDRAATGPASQPATRPASQPASQPATGPATQPATGPATQPATPAAGLALENVQWFPISDLPPLAFDHRLVVDYAIARLRAKLSYSPIAHAFMPAEFTLAELREVYEAVLGPELDRPLDPANFRRQMLAGGTLEPTGRTLQGTSHRPPRLYRFRADVVATSPTPPPRSVS